MPCLMSRGVDQWLVPSQALPAPAPSLQARAKCAGVAGEMAVSERSEGGNLQVPLAAGFPATLLQARAGEGVQGGDHE